MIALQFCVLAVVWLLLFCGPSLGYRRLDQTRKHTHNGSENKQWINNCKTTGFALGWVFGFNYVLMSELLGFDKNMLLISSTRYYMCM